MSANIFVDMLNADILTLEEAVTWLNLSASQIVAEAEQGSLPGRQVGSLWRFNQAAITLWALQDAVKQPVETDQLVIGGSVWHRRYGRCTVRQAFWSGDELFGVVVQPQMPSYLDLLAADSGSDVSFLLEDDPGQLFFPGSVA